MKALSYTGLFLRLSEANFLVNNKSKERTRLRQGYGKVNTL